MEAEAAQAAYEALHEKAQWHDGTFTSWSKDRSATHPYHVGSGVRVGVATEDLTPWDPFTTKVDASPVESVLSVGGEQIPSEDGEPNDGREPAEADD